MRTIGPYQLLDELGRGAMGVVFRGFDPAIGRPVAIKIIQTCHFATAVEGAELKLRLAREASAAGRLSHPNIVTVYQLGEENGVQYLVQELVDGRSWEQVLCETRAKDVHTILSILSQVAAGLDYAHAQGIIHRDVKPGNVLVRSDGVVKITDFGIARISSQTVTQAGMTFGTPAYMSPEQIASARVSGKADQYSLGVMAYEALAGRKPFVADTCPGLIHQIMSAEPPPLHTVNAAIPSAASAVVAKSLAKNPDDRFPTCSEFVRNLQEAVQAAAYDVNHAAIAIQPVAAKQSADPVSARTSVRTLRVGVLAVVGIAVAVAIWLLSQRMALATSVGLNEVEKDGQLQIRWDRNAPAVREGTDAVLTIQDGGSPVTIQLDGTRLHSGSVTYARHADRIQITLQIHEPKGKDVRDSSTFSGAAPGR